MDTQGTIKGKSKDQFDAEQSAEKLQHSFRGLGTDEKTIIDILTSHNSTQRQEISRRYAEIYGRDLITDLQDELGGHFLDTSMAMLYPPSVYDSMCLRRALAWGPSIDSSCLIDILCTRSNAELKAIKQVYFQENGSMLEQDLGILSNSHIGQILKALADGARQENSDLDNSLADKDIADLLSVGVKQIGSNGTAFNSVLCLRSRPQLELTFETYKKKTGVDLETDIRKEFTGDVLHGLLAFIKVFHNPVSYFAEKLNESMKGSDTDDDTLIRIIVSRSENDLEAIKVEYQQKYKASLTKAIRDDCSGDYCRLLLKIIGDT